MKDAYPISSVGGIFSPQVGKLYGISQDGQGLFMQGLCSTEKFLGGCIETRWSAD